MNVIWNKSKRKQVDQGNQKQLQPSHNISKGNSAIKNYMITFLGNSHNLFEVCLVNVLNMLEQ